MPETTYLLIDPDSGEPVGLHVVAAGLESSPEEISQALEPEGKPRLKAERVPAEKLRSLAADRLKETDPTQNAFGAGGVVPSAGAEGIARRYRRERTSS